MLSEQAMRALLDEVLRGQQRLELGQQRLEEKLDRLSSESARHRAEFDSVSDTVDDHHKILLLGNGTASLSVRVANLENHVKANDPAAVRREKLANWGKIITLVGLVVSQVFAWVFGLPK